MDFYEIEKIIEKVCKFNISYFEYKDNEMKIKMVKRNNIVNKNIAIHEISCSKETFIYHQITSKYVGVVKLLHKETLEPFGYIGMKVKCDDILCEIEYLNITIDIISEYSGIISDICVKNNDLIDYGKKIMIIAY
ncbi:acetyl-CoA carboxylase biotin carboxyl carrier protein [Clostridium hydrogenum]|uniref:acetyl-CoA carboxylase biotin carboxyl carrier protein n=1 Tax=Clostridium hydrogenum TaxID=2855764 RepID=UPI001F30754F|nr:biotin/lipoyl-containing protein [Clostridium hydrogenum]